MGATVYGRRAIRRVERETGLQVVHMNGAMLTTVDHRHYLRTLNGGWGELAQTDISCMGGLYSYGYSSCRMLFGEPDTGFTRGLLRGPCRTCGVGCSMLHRWDCAKLNEVIRWPSLNPDYWPRPVHRPRWFDDPRRVRTLNHSALELAYVLDAPLEALLMGGTPRQWTYWESAEANEIRHAVNQVIAEVSPDILRSVGLDPERYRVVYE